MKIIELKQMRTALVTEARSILNTAEGLNRDLNTEERALYDAKLAEAEAMKGRIEREERQARLEAENAVPVGGVTPAPQIAIVDNTRGSGPMARFVNCIRAVAKGKGDERRAAQYADEVLHDADLARALSASVAASCGFAVPDVLSQEFIEYLRPASVVRSAGAQPVPLANGNLSIPKITGGATASYGGENTNAAATQQTVGQVRLIAKKLTGLIPISNDLLRFANPQTDTVIRGDLIRAVSQTEDLAFLRGDGTTYSPKGMRNWANAANFVTAVALSGTSLGYADVTAITLWLGSMITALLNAAVPVTMETGCFFLSARSFMALRTLRTQLGTYAFPELSDDPKDPRLLGYRVKMTPQIPTNLVATPTGGSQITTASEIYFANMPDCLIGEAVNLLLDVSTEATYVDAGNNTISAFSQDQTVIRVIEENDFAVRYDKAVAVATAVPF